MATRNVGILIFDEVEVLDFCGPLEVFSVAGREIAPGAWDTFTIAGLGQPIRTRGGLTVTPKFSLADAPRLDVLLIPGGQGTRPLIHDADLIQWIVARSSEAELLLSVCTGALLLAKGGLLDGLSATTHHGALDLLRQLAPETLVRDDVRWVDNGRVITSAGIAAGIDMSLYAVSRLLGQEIAERTAAHMEYPCPRWEQGSAVSCPPM